LRAIILAAGQGKRMRSKTPKVLHKLMGKPILQYSVEACLNAGIDDITVVVSPDIAAFKEAIPYRLAYAVQEKPLGMGHAVASVRGEIKPEDDVLILYGDMPLINAGLIVMLAEFYKGADADTVVVAASMPGASDLGRVYADGDKFIKIAEFKDIPPGEPVPDLVNAGISVYKGEALLNGLAGITNENSQNEFYLTDVPGVLTSLGFNVRVYRPDMPPSVFSGTNDFTQLAEAAANMRARINARHMDNGVQMLDPSTAYIDDTVEIAEGVVLYPSVILEGKCKLEAGAVIGANSRLVNTTVGRDTHIQYSVLNGASVGKNTEIGPFAYLRPGAVIGDSCRVGDFVEVKNANIGDRTKIAHLGYVGDADIGENVNWGCGAITANYDGKNKSRTTVMDNVFIGCNTNLIAPVTIGEGAFIAGGSTITDEVPPGSLAIARQRQVVKMGWKNNTYTN
jgi:bifunctional UDP-N-acetylglucosamine pyrophosphorylase/glucosamine-1-phosphate N-acetyltransferase